MVKQAQDETLKQPQEEILDPNPIIVPQSNLGKPHDLLIDSFLPAIDSYAFGPEFCRQNNVLVHGFNNGILECLIPRGSQIDPYLCKTIAAYAKCDVFFRSLDEQEWQQLFNQFLTSKEHEARLSEEELHAWNDHAQAYFDPFAEDLDRETLDRMARDEPLIRLVDELFEQAITAGASDLHIEAESKRVRVRLRINGALIELRELPLNLFWGISSRIKIMTNLNIMERRLPQDGRLSFETTTSALDIRVSILPSTHGESIVLRLLPKSIAIPSLGELGMDQDQQRAFLQALSLPQGLILLTGPTGSGKSTTLHALLSLLAGREAKIVALEDPVERKLDFCSQLSVQDEIGLSFASLLRRVLRHDPDIIMIGEIRDSDTAQLAVRAAMTGHLVISTLHTNDALGAIERLRDLGIQNSVLANVLTLCAAQRLVRSLCQKCHVEREATDSEQRLLLQAAYACNFLPQANSCPHCKSGFDGRRAIWEVLPLSKKLKAAIASGIDSHLLEELRTQEAWPDLKQQGIALLRAGFCTLADLQREVAL